MAELISLLIVDDEPLITDSFYDLFAGRSETEFNILRAYSGQEALGLVEKVRIDILLTDISMPDVSGLDVHRFTSKLWPECLVIYLTSFDDFDFARQAVRNRGVDYILKTEGDDAVLQAVDSAVSIISERRKTRMLAERAKSDIPSAIPLLQASFIKGLVDGAEKFQADPADLLASLQIPLDGGSGVLLVLGQVDSWPENYPEVERLRLILRIKDMMESFFMSDAATISILYDRNMLLQLLQPASGGRSGFDERTSSLALRIRGSLDDIHSMCEESYGLSMSFAASGTPVEWNGIGGVFESLRGKLRREAGLNGAMLFYNELSPSQSGLQKAGQLIPHHIVGELKTLLESGDRDGFSRLFSTMTDRAVMQDDRNGYDIRPEIYYRLAAMIVSHTGGQVDEPNDIRVMDRISGPESFGSWKEAFRSLEGLAGAIFEQMNVESKRNANKIFTFIDDYAHKNIGEDLSLTRFSSLLNFHPFYLSRLFKQISGKSLSEYISELKMARAREMLEKGNEKIVEISAALGFRTSSYFISFFRKFSGMSPVEYRSSRAGKNVR